MKEYTIYCVCNGGTPYYLPYKPYNDLFEVKLRLQEIIESNNKKNLLSYVDNDFWNNEISELACLFYYQVRERNVGEWHKCIENEKSNITYLKRIDNF